MPECIRSIEESVDEGLKIEGLLVQIFNLKLAEEKVGLSWRNLQGKGNLENLKIPNPK